MNDKVLLRLAPDITVRISLPRLLSSLLPPPGCSSDAVCADLHVVCADAAHAWQAAPRDETMYWAQLAWRSPREAGFAVPNGGGSVRTAGAPGTPLSIDVVLDARVPERGLISALRLSFALSLMLRGHYLLHASAIQLGQRAALFLGASEAGKTTTARRLGREGALRFADDLVVVRHQQEHWLAESCCFDRASRLPGRSQSWPLAAAYVVRKGAAVTSAEPLVRERLRTWASAVFMPPPHPALAQSFLDGISRLAQEVPLRALDAAPSGSLLCVVRSNLDNLDRSAR